MADKKISALTGATTPLAGTEVLPIVQGGATVKVAVSDLTAGRAVAASSVNKVVITAPATASTLTIADGKTLAVNDNATLGTGGLTLGNSGGFTAAASKVLTASNTLTLAGTDATTHTFPTTSATIARTDAAQTFVGIQSFSGQLIGKGTATNDSAATGYIGEYVSSSIVIGSALALTSNNINNMTSISLTAGDWDISATLIFSGDAATNTTRLVGQISNTALSINGESPGFSIVNYGVGGLLAYAVDSISVPIAPTRVSLSSTTTMYLCVLATFSISTSKVFGSMCARRIR
jgi:hypothetical protein